MSEENKIGIYQTDIENTYNISTITNEKQQTSKTNSNSNQDKHFFNSLLVDMKKLKESGKCGIKNLGNTCYMNSALQILAHTKELISYFLHEEYKADLKSAEEGNSLTDIEEINKNKFVKNFAEFLNAEWLSNTIKDAYNPQELRKSLTKVYPLFQENTQQDAHEFLICILDLFHQQLNRKENKNDEIVDSENMFSSQNTLMRHLSQRCWDSHLEINDSKITDLFFGQLKSTTKCLNCKYENLTYDPFSNLGLPIPNEYKTMIYFIPIKKNQKPIKMFLKVNDNMQYKNLIEIVKHNLIEYKFNTGIFYFVLNNKLVKLIDLDERCGDLMNRQAFLFLIESSGEEIISKGFNDSSSYNEDKFYVCLNFFMFEDDNVVKKSTKDKRITNGNNKVNNNMNQKSNLKSASSPRIFSFDYSSISQENCDSDNIIELIDDKKVTLKIFNLLIWYVKPFIQGGDDFKELLENKLVNFSVKAVDKIYYSDALDQNENEVKFLCLFCGKENSEVFLCDCINKLIFSSNTFDSSFDFSNSILTYYIKNRKHNSEFILDVNINISVEIIKYRELNRCKDNTQKYQHESKLDLIDLLDFFMAEEKLTLQENYHCNHCDKNVIAYKKMEINKFPQILVFHLKRFRYESSNYGRARTSRRSEGNCSITPSGFAGEKNEKMIDFQINNLELGKYNKGNKLIYELYAVCNHSGKLDSGHYTAICKHPYTHKWLEYDDKIVKDKGNETIVTSDAYMLFYRRKTN